MLYKANTIQWRKGDVVIHDADAKQPRMLMRVIGFTRDGLVKTQYIDTCRRRKVFENELAYLHDPVLFNLNPQWVNQGQMVLEYHQHQWEQMNHWNRRHVDTVTDVAFLDWETGRMQIGTRENVTRELKDV